MVGPVSYLSAIPTAHASIFSDIAGFFSGQHVSAQSNPVPQDSSSLNSQEMPLLEAPSSPLLGSSSDSEDLFIQTNKLFLSRQNILGTTSQAAAQNLIQDTQNTQANSNSNTSNNNNSTNNQSGDQIITYTVKSGDNVTTIAKSFGISVNTVLWANNLRVDSVLKVGQKLVILPITGISYTVQSGDTLQALAKKYKGDVDEIMSYNNLSSDTLKAGQTIVIPDGEMGTTQSSSSSSGKSIQSSASAVIKKVATAALGIKIANADTSQITIADNYYMRPILAGVRTQGVHGHNAVDLADSCGTPVYASAAGIVTVATSDGKWNGGYGNYVVINHSNGSQTLYAHLSQVLVSAGMQVTQAQEIGIMGETGEATGCHVHFEIRDGIANPF